MGSYGGVAAGQSCWEVPAFEAEVEEAAEPSSGDGSCVKGALWAFAIEGAAVLCMWGVWRLWLLWM